MRTILAIVRVELLRFVRERSNVFFVFLLPLLLVILIGSQFGGGMQPRVGVIAPDGDPLAAEIVEALDGEGTAVVAYDDPEELADLVARGNLVAGVVVPDGYEAAVLAGEPVQVRFVSRPDGTSTSITAVLDAVVAAQDARYGAARTAADEVGLPTAELVDLAVEVRDQLPGVSVTTQATGRDALAAEFAGLGQFDLGASSQLFLFVFLTSLGASAALIQTRQLGVARRMLSTPAPLPAILLGQMGGRLSVALVQAVYIVGATWLLFRVNWGDPLAAGAVVVLFCLVSAGAGMLLGSVFRNDAQASGAGVGLGLVLAALGGSMAPLEIFPEVMQRIAMVTPHRWANTAMAEIVRRGGGIGDVATELAVLAVYALVLVVAAIYALRRALTR